MPLRDHFGPPLDDLRHWEGFHATWPVMMVAQLRRRLPQGYFAEPRVHTGAGAEIDVATFERESHPSSERAGQNGGGVATAVWAPPRPTLSIPTDLPSQPIYEVRVYDQKRHSRLVAAVEIVSPANKDRPEHRQAFVGKCAGLLQEHVSVVIVDVVTTRAQNLYSELVKLVGQPGASFESPLYAAACRVIDRSNTWLLETWVESLEIGRPLPTMPVWLTDELSVPLELEESYEESCAILDLP